MIQSQKKFDSDFTIRLFDPVDAEGVALLFKEVYGDGYPIRTYYNPLQLIKAFEEKEIIPAVAVLPTGKVVAFMACYRSAPHDRVYETGVGLTLVEYRKKGLSERLIEFLCQNLSRVTKMETIFGEAVTNHIYTQKISANAGMRETALEVDLMPAEAYTKENSAQGRVSALLLFKHFPQIEKEVYLPEHLDGFLREIYQEADFPRKLLKVRVKNAKRSESRLEEAYFDFARVNRITLWETGADLPHRLAAIEARIREKGGLVMQCWLRLDQDTVGWSARVLSDQGYFCGGILPGWFEHDGLLMQKVMAEPNWQGIKLYSDRSEQLLKLVKDQWITTK
jgi:hypothetical protein